MSYQTIEVRKDGAAAWLTLNRPERLNALNPQMVNELRDYFSGLTEDTETRVVVIRGAGRAFCAPTADTDTRHQHQTSTVDTNGRHQR